jgi:hypothetical protein
MMMYNIEDNWDITLCPSSGLPKYIKNMTFRKQIQVPKLCVILCFFRIPYDGQSSKHQIILNFVGSTFKYLLNLFYTFRNVDKITSLITTATSALCKNENGR